MNTADFYFAVQEVDDTTVIAITPKDYFDQCGCLSDEEIDLTGILPDDFEQAMDSTWITERDADEAREECIMLGFVENNNLLHAGEQD